MSFFSYDDELFYETSGSDIELEFQKVMTANEANQLTFSGTFYIMQRGYTNKQAKLLIMIRLHNLVKQLIDILIKIDEKNKKDFSENNRLIKLADRLTTSSLDLLKVFEDILIIKDYNDEKTYNVKDFFETNIDFSIFVYYRKDMTALLGYNMITTELGALMGVYDMLFGEDLLKLNKKYTTKYIFEMLYIII